MKNLCPSYLVSLMLVLSACGDDVADEAQGTDGDSSGTTNVDSTAADTIDGSTGEGTSRVEIIIDDNGIPHIYGRTDEDAFYGAAYQMAHDRLFHMETTRRRAQGRLAEVLGEEGFEDDEISRVFDFAGWGAIHTEKMKTDAPDLHALMSAWVDGVNALIIEMDAGEVPVPHGFGPDEFDFVPEPWTVQDIMAIATMTGFGNDLTFDAEIFVSIVFLLSGEAIEKVDIFTPARNTFTTAYDQAEAPAPKPEHASQPPGLTSRPATASKAKIAIDPDDLATTMKTLKRLDRLRVGMGSNSWAVSGEHTASGRPIVAGDPHLNWDIPGVFYAQHINSLDQDGTIDAAGFSFVGTPGISVGHTRGVVWTPTTAFADTMDVWAVQRPDGGDEVIVAGEVRKVDTKEAIIIVRSPGSPVGEGTNRSVLVETVEGGGVIVPAKLVPIAVGEDGDVLMMNWAGFVPSAYAGLLDFNRVEDIDSYEAAVAGFGGNFNFVSADVNGISHAVGTKVPKRTVVPESPPWMVMDGDLAATQWTGEYLPPEQLPGSRGGSRGFVCTANNDPFAFSQNGRLDDDPWYFGAFFAPGWRAERIESTLYELTAAGGITVQDMQALQSNTDSGIADDLLPILEEAWAEVGTDMALDEFDGNADLEVLAEMLLAWDKTYRIDDPEGLVFFAYQHFVTQRAIGDELFLLFQQAMDLQPVFIMKMAVNTMRGLFPEGDDLLQEGRNWIAIAALQDTADYLNIQFGGVAPENYKMSDVKFTFFNGTTGRGISRGKFPTAGSDDTINVAAGHSFFSAAGGVDEELLSRHGSIFRHVTTFAEDGTPEMFFNMPLGNVAEPDSPHYMDFNDDWLNGGYRKFWFTRAEVEAHEESRYTLLSD
ncbi:MAG: penicillin acylase family protein [Nannocystaceae bacterium]|nr:penicillin acylase family protein [Nannocystaceae bacterium]